jgi:hypothetical protein
VYLPVLLHGTETALGHHAPLSGTGPLVAVALLCLVVAVAVVLTRDSRDGGEEPRERGE